MTKIDKTAFVAKQNKKAISIKLHPKTIRLLNLLADKTSETKTDYLEAALWLAFSKGHLTDEKLRKQIQKIINMEYPK